MGKTGVGWGWGPEGVAGMALGRGGKQWGGIWGEDLGRENEATQQVELQGVGNSAWGDCPRGLSRSNQPRHYVSGVPPQVLLCCTPRAV